MIKNREKFGIKIMLIGTALNFALFLFKLYLSTATASICIYTDALNNLFDCAFCIIAIIGLGLAGRGKSNKYPMGFGRAEYLADFIISASLFGAGCIFLYNALYQTLYPLPLSFRVNYALVLAGTVPVKILMGIIYAKAGGRCDSELLSSMKRDSFYDAAITTVTVVSYALCTVTRFNIDGIAGMAISAVILANAFFMLRRSFRLNMGARDEALEDKIRQSLMKDKRISGAEIVINNYGVSRIEASCKLISEDCSIELLREAKGRVKADTGVKITFDLGDYYG